MAYTPQSSYQGSKKALTDLIGSGMPIDLELVLGTALAHTNPVIVRISDGTSAYLNPQTIRALTAADVVTADSLTKWGGTALTGRDISLDTKVLTDTKDTTAVAVTTIPKAKGKTTIRAWAEAGNGFSTIYTVTGSKTFYLVSAALSGFAYTTSVAGNVSLDVDTGGNGVFIALLSSYLTSGAAGTALPTTNLSLSPSIPMPFTAGTVFRARAVNANIYADCMIMGWEE